LGLRVWGWWNHGCTVDEAKRVEIACAQGFRKSEFCIDNLLVRIHYIIVMIKWTCLAPWEHGFRSRVHVLGLRL